MNIGSAYISQGHLKNYGRALNPEIMNPASITGPSSTAAGSGVFSSGDSISISEEALQLFHQSIHKYGDIVSAVTDEHKPNAETASSKISDEGVDGGTNATNASPASVKSQILYLRNQLSMLGNQRGEKENSGVEIQIAAIQAHIAALQAQ